MSDIRDRSEITDYINALVEARLHDRQSGARHVALYALGWCLFGLALWVLTTLAVEERLITFQLSNQYWIAIFPLLAGIVSIWTAFRHDSELRELEQQFLYKRIDSLAEWREHIS